MPLLKRAKPIVVEGRKSSVESFVRNDDKTHKFITTRRHPIYYMAITKCGSTFLKNLLYVLDHDRPHENPDYIHDYNQDFIRTDKTPAALIEGSNFAFTVLRKPSSRFLSLYFDKIYGEGPQNFPDMRLEIAKECGLDLSRDLAPETHRQNCDRLIGWIEKNLAGDTDIDINPHWRPQSTRIATVEHLRLTFLTLDGLDWQLPLYLGEMIEGLPEKMAQAKSRNRTAYPVDPTTIMTPDLEWRINEIYADDLVHYQHVSRLWKARRKQGAIPQPSVAQINVLTTHTQNFNLIALQKAGCTYLRNLTYQLDHGRPHPDPGQIASDGCLAHKSKSKSEIEQGVNVIVLRDPYARFFSLYFDKVWGEGDQAFPWIAKQIAKNRRFKKSRELSEAEHHDNCCRLLGFLQQRFNERPIEELNPHWQPQIVKARRAGSFGFAPVLLEQFGPQIRQLSEGRIKGLDAALEATRFKNATEKPIVMDALISPWIKERLQALYGEDIALYERIKAGWETGTPPEL